MFLLLRFRCKLCLVGRGRLLGQLGSLADQLGELHLVLAIPMFEPAGQSPGALIPMFEPVAFGPRTGYQHLWCEVAFVGRTVIQFRARRATGTVTQNVTGADPFVTEGDGRRCRRWTTTLTATFTPFATPFSTCTFAAFALCHVTVSTLILFLTQESVK